MAERKTGPVKPPVIDLEARESVSSASEPVADASAPPVGGDADAAVEPTPEAPAEAVIEPRSEPAADTPTEPEPMPDPAPRPDAETWRPPTPPPVPERKRAGVPASTLALAIGGGAVAGALLVYLLALAGLLPQRQAADPAPALAALSQQQDALAARLDTLPLDDAGLADRVAALEAAAPAGDDPAVADLTAQVATLGRRVEALGDGAGGADAAALADTIAALETRLAAIEAQAGEQTAAVADLRAALSTAQDDATAQGRTIASLQQGLSEARAELAARAGTPVVEMNAALQLPLLLSGLESAFSTGRSFATELASLATLLPEADIPASLRNAAGTGLAAPRAIVADLEAAIPEMLAVRPGTPEATWDQAVGDWLSSLLALRPTGEIAGTTPEAIVTQIEGAVSRGEFQRAVGLFEALPEPMRAAAGRLPADVAAQADAAAFLAAVRAAGITVRENGATP